MDDVVKSARPTLRDVADHAGLSPMTVSRVINGHPHVAEATIARARAAIDSVGYRRNDAARLLRPGQRSLMVGLVIADLHNPFYMALAAHLETVLRARGFDLVIANSSEDPDAESLVVDGLASRQCEGLLVVPSLGSKFSYVEFPVVCIDRAGDKNTSSVVLNSHGGAMDAVEHLLGTGHNSIALVGDDPALIQTSVARVEGYRAALEENGRAVDPSLEILGSHTLAEAADAVAVALVDNPQIDAIFAMNNRSTLGAITAMKRIGRQVSIVGFDDFDTSELLDVSVITYSFRELATTAVELLVKQMAQPTIANEQRVVPTALIARGSSQWPNTERGHT